MHDRYPNNQTHSLHCNNLSYCQEKHQELPKHWCQSNVCFMKSAFVFPSFLEFSGEKLCVYVYTRTHTITHIIVKLCIFLFIMVVFNNPLNLLFQNNFKMLLSVNRSMVIIICSIWDYKCICNKAYTILRISIYRVIKTLCDFHVYVNMSLTHSFSWSALFPNT